MRLNKTRIIKRDAMTKLTFLTVVVLGTGACSNGTEGVSSDATATTNVIATSSPLSEYADMLWGASSDMQHQLHQEMIRREELIAECMHNAGFEYIPHVPRITVVGDGRPDGLGLPTDREWVEQFGFGMANSHIQETYSPNPNDTILEGLSESERIAYQATMFGPPRFDTGIVTMDEMGCYGLAFVEATQDRMWAQDLEEFAPLRTALSDFYARRNAIITDADTDWANCMADVGFPGFSFQGDAQRYVGDSFSTAFGTYLNPSESPEFETFSQWEIDLALADFDCRIATNFAPRQAAVRWEAESEFLADHQAALNDLRVAYEQRIWSIPR